MVFCRKPNSTFSRDIEPGEAGVFLENDADAVGNVVPDRAAFEFNLALASER